MKKLNKKIFTVIITLMTIFLVTILFIFNYQNYSREQKSIEGHLRIMEKDRPNDDRGPIEKRVFMDSNIYTVILNDDKSISSIINHSREDISNEEIEDVAREILDKNNIKQVYIGNLFKDKYSYKYSDNELIIVNHEKSHQIVINMFITSLIIFIVIEIIIIFFSYYITKWITTPVEETFKKQKEFIADASHELKTPLAVIMASSDELVGTKNDTKLIENIKNESEKMSNLITKLLDLARLEDGKIKETFKEENLSKIILKETLLFDALAYEQHLTIKEEIDEDIFFNCNSNEIKELVSILLDNAIKHSYKNSQVRVSLKKDKNNIVFKVINEGKPINKEDEKKIFERFYRTSTDRNRKENRYGLGLAIAKNIVTIHNGKISAKSSDGYTTFKVIFYK